MTIKRGFNSASNPEPDVDKKHFFDACRNGAALAVKTMLSDMPEAAAWKDEDNNGETGLMYAASGGHLQVVKVLIRNKAALNGQNDRGSTTLMFAAQGGHGEVVSALLMDGADPNVLNTGKVSALMVAASEGHEHICRLLLSAGARAGDRDAEGMTPADFARENGFAALAAMLDNAASAAPAAPEKSPAAQPKPQDEKDIPDLLEDLKRAKEEALENINRQHPPAEPSPELGSLVKKMRKGKLSG